MGRAPCCDKANVKRGPWAPEEDAKLKSYIQQHGTGGNWITLPQKIGLKRCGKSCRLRWLNYLRPNIKHGGFSEEEDQIICSLYISIGSRWSIIAAQLPGRTDNDIKNYWNTRLKKKLLGKQRKELICRRKGEMLMKKGKSASSSVIRPSIVVNGNNDDNNNNNISEEPYWSELPVLPPMLYSDQEPYFVNDHALIRKLLIKLGGRFSCDDNGNQSINMVSQFPIDLQASSHDDHKFIASTHHVSSSMLPNTLYNNVDGQGVLPVSEVQNGHLIPSVFEELSYAQKFDGLEYLYGDTSGSSSVITCGESMDWGEMNSLLCTSTNNTSSDFRKFQECVYHEQLNNYHHGAN